MGLMDVLLSPWKPANWDEQVAAQKADTEHRQASAQALRTQSDLFKYQADEAAHLAKQRERTDKWLVDRGLPTTTPSALVELLVGQEIKTGQKVNMGMPEVADLVNMYAYKQAPGDREKVEAEASKARGEGALKQRIADIIAGSSIPQLGSSKLEPKSSAAPTLGTTPPDFAQTIQRPEVRMGLDLAGVNVGNLTPKLTWRDGVTKDGKRGQAAFDELGNMKPETFVPGKLDAQVQFVRAPNGGMRSVVIGGPDSPFPGHEIEVGADGAITSKGVAEGAPELVQQEVELADGRKMMVFVPATQGAGVQKSPPTAAKQLGADAANYRKPDGSTFPPTATLADVNAAGGMKISETTKEKGTAISGAQRALSNLDELQTRLKKGGRYDKTELVKMAPLGLLANVALPFSSGVTSRALWSDTLEAQIRDESGAAIAPNEMSRLYARFPISWTMDDADIDRTFNRLRTLFKNKARILDPAKASAFELANSVKGVKDGKEVMVFLDEGSQPKMMPSAEHFGPDGSNGEPITDTATGMTFDLIDGKVVRIR